MSCELTSAMIDAAAELEDSYGADACSKAAAMANAAVEQRDAAAAGFWGGVVVILSRSDTFSEAMVSEVDLSHAETVHDRLKAEAAADEARNVAASAESQHRVTKSMNDAREALQLRPRQSRES